jgi:predicted RNA-binding Zn ribbon-like protein
MVPGRYDHAFHDIDLPEMHTQDECWNDPMGPLKPTARFINDCVALDFLNSGNPTQKTAPDWMASGERMLSWLEQSQLVPAEVLRRIRSDTAGQELDRLALRARNLREWLRGFVDQHCGRPLIGIDISDFKLLNDILSRDEQYFQIAALGQNDSALTLQSLRRWATPESLLRAIATAVARLLCEVDFTRIRTCERCQSVFIDRTPRQARKWCSMSTCGNRAKQAAFRIRRKRPPR